MILDSAYQAPLVLRNGHFNTIYPTFFRKVTSFSYMRKRLELEDGDFMDLDWSKVGSERLVVLVHGLEGSSDSIYIRGMIKAFNSATWDGVAINFRGCSGEINRKLTSYHMGASEDLKLVVEHLETHQQYKEIVLVGFSLGGNVILKYLGEMGNNVPKIIQKAVTFSVPCDIPSTNLMMKKWSNSAYLMRFLRSLNEKLVLKNKLYPGAIQLPKGRLPRNFKEFDGCYTAFVHGFDSAEHYWETCSSKHFIPDIKVPTLLVNAKDDSFLGDDCYPYEIVKDHPHVYMEIPENGGHVGFVSFNKNNQYWSEWRALKFVDQNVFP